MSDRFDKMGHCAFRPVLANSNAFREGWENTFGKKRDLDASEEKNIIEHILQAIADHEISTGHYLKGNSPRVVRLATELFESALDEAIRRALYIERPSLTIVPRFEMNTPWGYATVELDSSLPRDAVQIIGAVTEFPITFRIS